MTFYEIFTDLATKNGLTPSAAAIKMGINKSNVAAWKRDGSTPQGKTLNKIASFFNVSADYLLGVSGWFMDLGWIIHEELTQRGVLLNELAKAIGVSEKILSDYESDKKKIPDNVFESIATYFGMTLQELLDKHHQYDKSRIPPEFDEQIKAYEASITDIESDKEDKRRRIGFDDFSYAMYNESKELTDEQKQMLLNMAQMFKNQLDKDKNTGN